MFNTLAKYCAISFFLFVGSMSASTLTFQFSGNLTQVPVDEAFGDISAGEAFHGSFSFDTAALDLSPADPTLGVYSGGAPLQMSVSIGQHVFTTSGSVTIGVLNTFADQYVVLGTSESGDLMLELFLQDDTGTAFDSDRLPLTPPQLSGFGERDFHLTGIFDGGQLQADGHLSALGANEVPEPASGAAVLIGSFLILVGARRKKHV